MALEYNPTIADYWKHRRVLVILTIGTLRTRRLVRHHQTEAQALTPNMSTRNRGSKSIFKALYAMYHEFLSSGVGGVGGVVLSRHQHVLLFESGHFFTPSLDQILTTPQPNLDIISPSLGNNLFLIKSTPLAPFLSQHTLHVPCASTDTLNIPIHFPFLPHHDHPRPLPSLPNSRPLSPEPLNSTYPILEARISAVAKIPRIEWPAPRRSQPFHACCGEGGSVARARWSRFRHCNFGRRY